MEESARLTNEIIIKSRKRVQNHGEVFTPKKIVNKMLDLPNVREACENLTATFLEPAAGEGIFLVEILKRKMKMVVRKYSENLSQFENYSLLALSTLYGIELLEDNAQKCVMNMYQVYYETYSKQAQVHGKKVKNNVLNSAKLIISKNIAQGNFLTRLNSDTTPIIISQWEPVNIQTGTKIIKVIRTDYTLNEVLEGLQKESGETTSQVSKEAQLSLFDIYDDMESQENKPMKYAVVKITDVYKEEMVEIDG